MNIRAFLKKYKKAESLIEVIIAIFVIAVGSGAATTLIVSALQANSFSRDNLVALNLAVEGLEAVRIIRDTNWLKFSYDKENCWNVLPEMGLGVDCDDPKSLLSSGYYTVDLNPKTYSWQANFIGTDTLVALDLKNQQANSNEAYRLGFIDITPNQDTNKNSNLLDDTDIYVTRDAITTETGVSRFYRMITITYLDDPNPESANEAMVESLVQWQDRGQTHQVKLSTILTNYQKE